jgi:hypothetical protein
MSRPAANSWEAVSKSDDREAAGSDIAGDESYEATAGAESPPRDFDAEMEEDRRRVAARKPILPEPEPFEKLDYDWVFDLREKFKDTGLQVIVKMASIELTPEKPEFSAGGWHVCSPTQKHEPTRWPSNADKQQIEGQMNERICATALYYLDSENITPSRLSFRMPTRDDHDLKVSQDQYNWLERIYGTSLGASGGVTDSCLQNYGSVETRGERLLAFPNVL